jgi:peptide/nickel transport system permease protein
LLLAARAPRLQYHCLTVKPAGTSWGAAVLSHARRWIVTPLVTLLAASFVLYTAVWLQPGNPLTLILGTRASPAQYRYMARKLGLDRPMPVRYWDWLTAAVHGNFGTSLIYKQSVASLIAPRILTTLLLVAYASVIILVVGVALGIIGGMSPRLAPVIAGLNGLGVAIPGFVAAEMLTAVFAVRLGWFPVLGTGQGLAGRLQHLTLPAFALAIASISYVSQITRAAVSAEEQSPHADTARGRGLTGPRILRRHVLRNAAMPIMTVSALTVASLLAGTLVVEYAFGLGGIGSLLDQSVADKDSDVVLAIGLILVLVFVITTTALDVLQYLMDPRLRQKGAAAWH